jgi:hypothetical protein
MKRLAVGQKSGLRSALLCQPLPWRGSPGALLAKTLTNRQPLTASYFDPATM